jgi:Protein of unknown function (DUF2934)
LTDETETSSGKAYTVSAPDPALQTVPMTDLEAGEHEAGMVSRASDKEDGRVEPTNVSLDDLEQETTNSKTPKDLRGETFFEPDKEEIARRAYHLYLARGQVSGHEMDDWMEAKRQLLEEGSSQPR